MNNDVMNGFFALWMFGAILLVVAVVVLLPLVRILQRAGFSGWFSLFYFFPGVNLVMLWVFAFSDWPALRNSGESYR